MPRATMTAEAMTDMSNVVALAPRLRHQPLPVRLDQHAAVFSTNRRTRDDVFWLKENAEFLNILECTNQPGDAVLDHYQGVYDQIEQRLSDFPQYYRFLLSICLDLEDLGIGGNKGGAFCHWVRSQGLPDAELSDLQRAEAFRLLSRRGEDRCDPELDQRLRAFIRRGETFAIPNKKAAYELTHIVFYLSEYGRIDPELDADAITSLQYAGLLAYLDQNFDLLAEICIALRYARHRPDPSWEEAVHFSVRACSAQSISNGAVQDDYHAYFVANWMLGAAGQEPFKVTVEDGPARFDMGQPLARPLQHLGQLVRDHAQAGWPQTSILLRARLNSDGIAILDAAEDSVPDFEKFFRIFARSEKPILQ